MMFEFFLGLLGQVLGPIACVFLRRYRYLVILSASMVVTALAIVGSVIHDLGWTASIRKLFSEDFYMFFLVSAAIAFLMTVAAWINVLLDRECTEGQSGSERPSQPNDT
jgi:hypothetical protein